MNPGLNLTKTEKRRKESKNKGTDGRQNIVVPIVEQQSDSSTNKNTRSGSINAISGRLHSDSISNSIMDMLFNKKAQPAETASEKNAKNVAHEIVRTPVDGDTNKNVCAKQIRSRSLSERRKEQKKHMKGHIAKRDELLNVDYTMLTLGLSGKGQKSL